MLSIYFLALTIFVCFVNGQLDVCYGEYGCFTARAPFGGTLQRPFGACPLNPSVIGTKFYLYTRSNRNVESRIVRDSPNLYFNPDLETKFIVHGFIENGFKDWIIKMKNALLNVGDYNVISVDWQNGCTFPNYVQAVANTQIVGADIAFLIKSLMTRYNIESDKFHIIGHSLGSHVAGFAGKRVPKLGRITALDPAGPDFENTDPRVRLDKTDATFVDVIHTDGTATLQLGMGLMQPLGHVDFYPNGGKDQPNCPKTADKLLAGIFNIFTNNLENLEGTTACSHTASVYFFIDSIENKGCKYVSYPCSSYDNFNKAQCLACGTNGCNNLGFWASKNKDNGKLYLNTQNADSVPFCQLHYKFTLNSNNLFGQTMAKGTFTIQLFGELGGSDTIMLDSSDNTFNSGSVYKVLSRANKNPGSTITSAVVTYKKTTAFLTSLLYQDQWSFKNIDVFSGDNQKPMRLCPTQTYLKSGVPLTFNLC